MKYFQTLTIALATISALAACSGGGNGRVLGTQCAKNTAPIDISLAKPEEKLDLETQLPEGEYIYDSTDVYFVDPATDFRILVRDGRQLNGQIKVVTACVRNASKLGDRSFGVMSVTELKVEPGNKITFNAKMVGFSTDDKGALVPVATPVEDAQKPQSPKDVYENAGVSEQFLFKAAGQETSYEIRSKGTTPEGATYQAISRFRKK